MKKVITLSIVSLLFMSCLQTVSAQKRSAASQTGTQQRIQEPALHEDAPVLPRDGQQGQKAPMAAQGEMPSLGQGIGRSTESLNRVAERMNNPEIGEQVRTMVQSHEKVQVRTKTAIQNMSKRNKALKFLIGPDYKNAGQVRSDVVGLRNDIDQLEKLKEDATTTDAEDIQVAIDELKVEADSLDTQIQEQTSGFSLFGWLAKRFAN